MGKNVYTFSRWVLFCYNIRKSFEKISLIHDILLLEKTPKFSFFFNFPLNGSNFIMQQNETILTRPNFFPYQTTIIFYDVRLRSHFDRSVLLMF